VYVLFYFIFFFSSRRRHTRFSRDWSSDVCSSDLKTLREKGVKKVKRDGSEVTTWPWMGRSVEESIKEHGDHSDCYHHETAHGREIGRASCRERVWISVEAD